MKEIKSFIKEVCEKTGIKVFLQNENIVNDAFTSFDILIDGNNYAVKVLGDGQAEKNYALLIKELAKTYKAQKELTKTEFLLKAIQGELSEEKVIEYSKKHFIKQGGVCVMLIRAKQDKVFEIKEVVNNYGFGENDFIVDINENEFALIKFAYASTPENFSMAEYADFLYQSILEETGYAVQIFTGGTVKGFTSVSKSYSQAQTVERMCIALGYDSGVYSFKQFLIARIIEDMDKQKLEEYVELINDEGIKELMSDEEVVSTAHEFLECNLNASLTARKMYLHRNTLAYRLDKIQRESGLDIRKFSDAVTFRIITLLLKSEE